MKTLSQSDVKVLREALETALNWDEEYPETLTERATAALAILDAQEAAQAAKENS